MSLPKLNAAANGFQVGCPTVLRILREEPPADGHEVTGGPRGNREYTNDEGGYAKSHRAGGDSSGVGAP